METPVILNAILGIAEPVVITCCLFYFLHNIKRDIFKRRFLYITAFLFYSIGFAAVMILSRGNNLYLIFFQLVTGNCIGYYLFHRNLLQIFYVTSYITSIFLMQALVVWFLFAQLQNHHNLLDYTAINTALLVKDSLAVLITGLWIWFINRRRLVQLSRWGYVSLFIPLAVSMFLLFAVLRAAEVYMQLYGSELIALTVLSVVVLNVYFIYLVSYVSKSSRLKHELSLLKAQNEMQFRYYDTLEGKYDDLRKLIHDIKNHLNVLEELYKNGHIEKAQQYDADLRMMLQAMGQVKYSDCKLLNIILNEKMKEAKEAGIAMDIRIRDIDLEQVKDTDITTIFANLLDNAVEAAGRHAPGSYIRIQADSFHNFVVINIENSIAPGEHKDEERGYHQGLGLLNVKNAVEAYGGSYHIEEDNEAFRASVNLPL